MSSADVPGPTIPGNAKESSDSTVPRPIGLPTPIGDIPDTIKEIPSKEVMSPKSIPKEVDGQGVVPSKAVEPSSSTNDEKVLSMLQVLASAVAELTKSSNEKDEKLQLLERLIIKREEK